ncbi:hypothetical protein ACLOJK_010226 [Asimina triloba]
MSPMPMAEQKNSPVSFAGHPDVVLGRALNYMHLDLKRDVVEGAGVLVGLPVLEGLGWGLDGGFEGEQLPSVLPRATRYLGSCCYWKEEEMETEEEQM